VFPNVLNDAVPANKRRFEFQISHRIEYAELWPSPRRFVQRGSAFLHQADNYSVSETNFRPNVCPDDIVETPG